jgi:superfamily I DNA/RNA helicase
MKKALNQYNKLIDIMESTKKDTYTCPVCKEILTRNFGEKSQYYSHPKGKGQDCELKLKLIIKEDNLNELSQNQIDILKTEYYEKAFNDVHIELSDYKSEEGYYLTQEQKNIIFSKENKIKISALAGSAKSSTLYYYAKERHYKKILYLVYNRAMKDEADQSFGKLSNVTIKTTHGLAFGYVGNLYKRKLTNSYKPVDIIKDLKLNWNTDMELANKIHYMMNQYMLSNVKEFEELDLYKDESGNSTEERELIINKCKQLWELKKEYNNNVKVEHDFYLKLFHLGQKDLSHKYDIVMIDEAQDSNLIVLDIIKNSRINGVAVVGDPLQQIYSWRNATNIMPLFEGKEYTLTTSFRVSQNIANIANIIVQDINNKEINMKGFNSNQKIVSEINKNEPYVCLCRTNAYIFAEVFETLNKNKNAKLFFEGGYFGYAFQNIKDAWFFSLGYQVKNPMFNKFKDYYSMIEYAKNIEDLELIALDKMINKYGHKIPQIVDGIKNNTVTKKENADVIFSTIHRSKGQTYTIPVYISDDCIDLSNIFKKAYIDKENINLNNYYEELCILYVAITRAAGEIQLNDNLKKYLVLKWKYFNNQNN